MTRLQHSMIALAVLAMLPALGQAAIDPQPASLADFSLEELGEVVVTSVARQEGRLADAPASIYVIRAADIQRSGASSLAEALRLAPNLHVAQANTQDYAITARGFSSTLANKLLVMIDGRSVYSPLFSGVFWETQDVMLEDVERIEVISGPGATIWGANAVNGVINIITRHSADTQGGLLSADAGRRAKGSAIRYGGKLASGASYRVYGKHQRLADTLTATGAPDSADMRRTQAGFRVDWMRGADAFTVSGDAYRGRLGEPVGPASETEGANLMARMVRDLGPDQQLRLQMYIDHTGRRQPGGGGGDKLDTIDLEAQHGVRLGQHQVVWGGGYRHARDRVEQGPIFKFFPTPKELHWANLFAQDEITVHPDLKLTVGLKLEHNNYTGVEALPNVHLAWRAHQDGLLWAGLSRTVRAPARIDRDLRVDLGSGGLPFAIAGGPDFRSETARALEIGYRHQPLASLSFSATAFLVDYARLSTLEPVGPATFAFQNRAEGRARGIELWGRYQATKTWRLDAGLVQQKISEQLLPGSNDITSLAGLGTNDPERYWSLRSSHEITPALHVNVHYRSVGQLPAPVVRSYRELDVRMAWRPRADVEIALSGINLLNRKHLEFSPAGAQQFAQRSVQLQGSLRF